MRRVIVAGTSGAGKTTLARQISAALGLPYTEIDGLFHGPDWQPRASFVEDVEAFTSAPAWVTEWQYSSVQPLLAERADTMVWLHFRRTTVMRRLVCRTVSRRVRGMKLWNGNTEPPLRTLLTDRDHVIRWAWRTHRVREQQAWEAVQVHGLALIELRNQREVDRWLESLRGG